MYELTLTDGNGVVAKETIPGDSKDKVLEDNQYRHCKAEARYVGRAEVSLTPQNLDPKYPDAKDADFQLTFKNSDKSPMNLEFDYSIIYINLVGLKRLHLSISIFSENS